MRIERGAGLFAHDLDDQVIGFGILVRPTAAHGVEEIRDGNHLAGDIGPPVLAQIGVAFAIIPDMMLQRGQKCKLGNPLQPEEVLGAVLGVSVVDDRR